MRSRAEAAWSNNDRSFSIAGLFDGKCMLMFLHCWSSMAAKWLFQHWLRCMNTKHRNTRRDLVACIRLTYKTDPVTEQDAREQREKKQITKHLTSQQMLLFTNSLRNISQWKWMNHLLTFMWFQICYDFLSSVEHTQRNFGECAGCAFNFIAITMNRDIF